MARGRWPSSPGGEQELWQSLHREFSKPELVELGY